MIDKRKPFKTCPICQRRLKADMFKTRKRINAKGETTLYLFAYCTECHRIASRKKYTKVEKPEEFKRCHSCFTFKPITEYRKNNNYGITLYENHCKECEATRQIVRHHEHYVRREHDTINNKHYIAFIGDASYKEICAVFKIRYEK